MRTRARHLQIVPIVISKNSNGAARWGMLHSPHAYNLDAHREPNGEQTICALRFLSAAVHEYSVG